MGHDRQSLSTAQGTVPLMVHFAYDHTGRLLAKVALKHGQFTLRSGRTSEWYFDKYLFETQPLLLHQVTWLLRSKIQEMQFQRIAGPELGGIALATSLSLLINKPSLYVRKRIKEYGREKLVEGHYEEGEQILLVEDVLTTGIQAIEATNVLRGLGLDAIHVLAVLDREEGAAENMQYAGLSYSALYTLKQLQKWRLQDIERR